jgi:hypothetical protein
MPERDNDKLEEFFRKVSGRPNIPFNEKDWEKLESMLNERDARSSGAKRTRNKAAAGAMLAILLLTGISWLRTDIGRLPEPGDSGDTREIIKEKTADVNRATTLASPHTNKLKMETRSQKSGYKVVQPAETGDLRSQTNLKEHDDRPRLAVDNFAISATGREENHVVDEMNKEIGAIGESEIGAKNMNTDQIAIDRTDGTDNNQAVVTPSPIPDKNMQITNLEPLGRGSETDANAAEERVTAQTKELASPRLSVLLSFAPDFTSTSFNDFSAPGRAFGLIVHYHVHRKWSLAAGIASSHKKYTGDGEVYKPPKGYWNNNTNGITPQTVDGSCNILEIPVMFQYTIAEVGRSKFLMAAGASSYIMLNEAYHYNFEEPNPGAKEGWESKERSGFLFNMVNLSLGFEYQILPRFRLGVEPYLKIPIEDIGWSNLKLYSAGAAVTLRYTVIRRNYSSPHLSSDP